MLEAFVSSRTRRALLERILTRPTEHFYLRGLAKELSLSVSPLRRELKRLEQAGLLRSIQEGNILFYEVNTTSPAFLQLQPASLKAEAPSVVIAQPTPPIVVGRPGSPEAIPVSVIAAEPHVAVWRSPLSQPMLVAAAGVGMVLLLIAASLAYLTLTNQRLMSQASKALAIRTAEVTAIAPKPSASGTMQGHRWRVVPGGFGGFSAGASSESY